MRTLALVVLIFMAGIAVGRLVLPSTAHSQSAPFSAIAGDWFTHGGALEIHGNGTGWYQLREYENCKSDSSTACDYARGNVLYSGRYARFTLTSLKHGLARGYITDSSQSWEFMTPISIRVGHNLLTVHTVPMTVRYCNDHSPAGACGA